MSVVMKSPESSNGILPKASYNTRALIRCDAVYLGASLPTKTTQPPGIIHEPLERICEKENLPTSVNTPKKPVRLYVFHSGIIIELLFGKHNGELVWYPIQNLYCSAGLQPLKTKHGTVEFRTLDDQTAGKSSLKPLFSVVFRETVRKKVLQCHAFAVARKELAQLLVQATALAYRDKHGWNQPLNNEIFGNIECNYTLNIVDEVHTDSGYSDHEESSQKSGQSPQSSELSTDTGVLPHLDNQKFHNHILVNTPSSSTASLATSKDTMLPGSGYESPTLGHNSLQRSPSISGASANFSGHSGDEQDSSHSTKAASSMSSGYPLSRDSSTIAAPTSKLQQVSPPVILLQQQSAQNGPPYKADSRAKVIRQHSYSGKSYPVSLDTFDSLSLDPTPSRAQQKADLNQKRHKPGSLLKPVKISVIPEQVVHHSPRSQPQNLRLVKGGNVISQYYQDPIYVAYHPEQFMYEGDSYRPHLVTADTKSSRSKERHRCSKETKKVQVKPSTHGKAKETPGYSMRKLDEGCQLSMERRLTKKSIPRQIL